MKKISALIVIFSAFLAGCAATLPDVTGGRMSGVEKIAVSTSDLRKDYEALGSVKVAALNVPLPPSTDYLNQLLREEAYKLYKDVDAVINVRYFNITFADGIIDLPTGKKAEGTAVKFKVNKEDPQPGEQAKPLPITSRSFKMGFVPIPRQPLTTEAWLDAFDVLSKNADFVLHHAHIDWEAFADTVNASPSKEIDSLNFVSGMAGQKGLKLFIVIDPLKGTDRGQMDDNLPPSWRADFGDAKVRSAFKNFSERVARDYKPAYMGLGSEVNTYLLKHPDDAENFISLYKETYELVKKLLPGTKITATFQFESLSGTYGGNPHWEMIKSFEPYLDVMAITTYPSVKFTAPRDMPDDYYSQIKTYIDKPIVVAESGWPTGGEVIHGGSERNQAEFLVRFVELTKDINMELWIWWFLHDWAGEGYADYFKTLGLRQSNGSEKPSWKIWQKIFNLPK